nr:hypothetical protein [uncultured Clostridium sp.]
MIKITKHLKRRFFITLFPLVIAIIVSYVLTQNIIPEDNTIQELNFIESVKMVIGMWSTLLGFIITAVSILVAFTGSRLTEEIKRTGHFKTVLYTYILTCFSLISAISIFVPVVVSKFYSELLYAIFIAALVVTLINVIMCIVFLSLVVYSIFK